MSCADLYANRTKNGGRRLPDVKHECYGKLSVKSVLKCWHLGVPINAYIAPDEFYSNSYTGSCILPTQGASIICTLFCWVPHKNSPSRNTLLRTPKREKQPTCGISFRGLLDSKKWFLTNRSIFPQHSSHDLYIKMHKAPVLLLPHPLTWEVKTFFFNIRCPCNTDAYIDPYIIHIIH